MSPAVFVVLAGVSNPASAAVPPPQRASSGVLKPEPVVHAVASDPLPAGAPLRRQSFPSFPTTGNEVPTQIPQIDLSMGAPLPDPLDAPAPTRGPDALTVFRDTTVPIPKGHTSLLSEPSTDQSGGNIFATGNTHAEFSKDDGRTWQTLDVQTIFGPGFCCDQATVSDRAHDREHWVLRYSGEEGAPGHLTLASSSDLSDWCPYTIQTSSLGIATPGASLERPDLVVGSRYLYLSARIAETGSEGPLGAAVLRVSLEDLAACRPAHVDWVVRTDVTGELRVAQGTADTAFIGSVSPRDEEGRTLRVLVWPENTNEVTTVDRALPPFVYMNSRQSPSREEPDCSSEDGVVTNWCRANTTTLSATRAAGGVWFAWDAQQEGDRRPYPYVRITQLRESDLSIVASRDLFGTTVAHILPAIAADTRGHLAFVDSFGGGRDGRHYYPGAMLALFDDLTKAPTLDFFLFGRGNGCDRQPGVDVEGSWGDYNTIRAWQGASDLWTASTYAHADDAAGLSCGSGGANVTTKNIVFGRERARRAYEQRR